jgi:hypothetical protein
MVPRAFHDYHLVDINYTDSFILLTNSSNRYCIWTVSPQPLLLDFVVHPPELPLLFSNPSTVGLGLWSSGLGFIVSVILEITLLGSGVTIYLATRRHIAKTSG